MPSEILGLDQCAPGQQQMNQTSNDADSQLEKSTNDLLAVTLSADVTLTLTQFRRAFAFVCSGNSSTHALTVPANKRFFLVENNGSASLNVVCGSASLAVGAGTLALFKADGTTNGLKKVTGSTSSVGTLITVALSAGANNDVDPGSGFPAGVDRLDFTAASGDATLNSLLAGSDGQTIACSNQDTTNNVIVVPNGTATTAANKLSGPATLTFTPGDNWTLKYYAGSINRWRILK